MQVTTIAERLLFSTVRIEVDGPHGPGAGTAFILAVKRQGRVGHGIFLVTNKHVVLGATAASFFFTLADEHEQPLIGQRFDVRVEGPQLEGLVGRWYGHPDPAIDIAITPLVPILDGITAMGRRVFFQMIPAEYVPTPEQIEKLDAIEDVLFIGYPNGIYDQRNLLPVTRRGITATPLQVDLHGEPKFLIDASVFGGSSGSPVFIANEGGYNERGTFTVGGRLLLVGVVAEVAYIEEEGRIAFKAIPTAHEPVAITRQMLDLGVVYKASTVIDTVESYLTLLEQNAKSQ